MPSYLFCDGKQFRISIFYGREGCILLGTQRNFDIYFIIFNWSDGKLLKSMLPLFHGKSFLQVSIIIFWSNVTKTSHLLLQAMWELRLLVLLKLWSQRNCYCKAVIRSLLWAPWASTGMGPTWNAPSLELWECHPHVTWSNEETETSWRKNWKASFLHLLSVFLKLQNSLSLVLHCIYKFQYNNMKLEST